MLDRMAKNRALIFDTGTNTAWTGGPRLQMHFSDQEDILRRALPLGLLTVLALPASALADTFDAPAAGKLPDSVGINSIWRIGAAMGVMFMQPASPSPPIPSPR